MRNRTRDLPAYSAVFEQKSGLNIAYSVRIAAA